MLFVALAYFILFSWLAYKNFKTAAGLLILFLPSYFIRFNIGPLPTTVLEITFGAIFLVWLIKYAKGDCAELKSFIGENKVISGVASSFLGFSILGVLISGQMYASLGIWRAYFLEPFLFFVVLVARRKEINKQDLMWYLSLSTISIAVLAIVQKFTGMFYSPTLEVGELSGKVTSFFTTPNAIGLYLAPIVPLMVYGLKDINKKKYYITMLILSGLAIFWSYSEGAWVALLVGVLVAVFLLGYRKIAVAIVLAGLICATVFAPLRESLLFQNPSGQNRLTLWRYTWNYVTKDNTNFIFGAGTRQFFNKIQKPVNNFKKIEPLIYPHNIFLNFWSEIGLLGMLAFVVLYGLAIRVAWKLYKVEKFLGIALLVGLVVYLVHGLVDVPYFKNDLAFLWWIYLTAIII